MRVLGLEAAMKLAFAFETVSSFVCFHLSDMKPLEVGYEVVDLSHARLVVLVKDRFH